MLVGGARGGNIWGSSLWKVSLLSRKGRKGSEVISLSGDGEEVLGSWEAGGESVKSLYRKVGGGMAQACPGLTESEAVGPPLSPAIHVGVGAQWMERWVWHP